MTASNEMATALLAEHFGYTPLTLLDQIINTVNELARRVVDAVENGLNEKAPSLLGFRVDDSAFASEESRQEALEAAKQMELENGLIQLETLLNATIDKDFDKFEIYTLRNILAVGHEEEELAGWVRLEHYKNLDLSSAANAPTPEQVQLQRRKLYETIKLNNMLKAEEARNSATLSKLQTLVGERSSKLDATPASPFAFLSSLQQSSKTAAQQPLNQNVQYTIRQLPALRDLLSQLKDSQQTIPHARHAAVDDSSVQARRRLYVESQSRRILERKGADMVDPATVGAAAGRKVSREEVEGIEAVVQALGGAAPLRRDDDEMEE